MTSPKPQITRVAAYGLVVKEARLLLCRISARLPLDAGQWTLPGGGIDFGEAPDHAMVREVEEESGLLVRPLGLAGIDSVHDEDDERAFHGIRILYHTELVGGVLRNETNGTTDLCAWWSQAEADELPLVDLAEVGVALAFKASG